MFSLIRRISYGVIPRPDRPWEEDATSNAPAPRRKRRLSSTERDVRQETEELARGKKARSGSQSPEAEAKEERETPLPQPEAETTEVKEVTKGVKEVVLEDSPQKPVSEVEEKPISEEEPTVAPESVPLPEGGNTELEDLADEDAPSSPAGSEDEMVPEDVKETEATKDVEAQPAESKVEENASTAVTSEATSEKKDSEDLEESKSEEEASKPKEQGPTSPAEE